MTYSPPGPPFSLRVGDGLVPGSSWVDVFGRNEQVSNALETLWQNGGLYPYLAAAAAGTVVSSSPNDTIAGTGAQVVELTYLDGSLGLQTASANMNGATPVVIGAGDIFRPLSMRVTQWGTGLQNAGDIDLTVSALVRARIAFTSGLSLGFNTAELGLYTVPANKRAWLDRFFLNSDEAGGGEGLRYILRHRASGSNQGFRILRDIGTAGTHVIADLLGRIPPFPAGTDIKIDVVRAQGSNNLRAAGGFNLLLEDV